MLKRYLKIWSILTANSFKSFLISRFGAILFLTGKIVRFVFFLGFLLILVSRTEVLAGYTLWQILLFYLTFNFIDVTTQMLFREVYRFRQQVVSGHLDLLLTKPVNTLFRALFGGTDLLDFVTLIPLLLLLGFAISKIPGIDFLGIVYYILLVGNAMLIALSVHIFVVSLAILTTEIDHAIMIYRDFLGVGKVPIDVYIEPLRSFFTFVIPIGVMISYPVKALIGFISFQGVLTSFVVGFFIFSLSILSWRYAISHYTSFTS